MGVWILTKIFVENFYKRKTLRGMSACGGHNSATIKSIKKVLFLSVK